MEEKLYLDDITGTIGEWLEMDASEIPADVINALKEAYKLSAKEFN